MVVASVVMVSVVMVSSVVIVSGERPCGRHACVTAKEPRALIELMRSYLVRAGARARVRASAMARVRADRADVAVLLEWCVDYILPPKCAGIVDEDIDPAEPAHRRLDARL